MLIELPEPKPAQEPRVRRIHMDWRHIEVAVELPVGVHRRWRARRARHDDGGVAAAAPTIQVAISSLSAEQADWGERRTDAERAVSSA